MIAVRFRAFATVRSCLMPAIWPWRRTCAPEEPRGDQLGPHEDSGAPEGVSSPHPTRRQPAGNRRDPFGGVRPLFVRDQADRERAQRPSGREVPLPPQLRRLDEVRTRFPEAPILVVENKCDILRAETDRPKVSALTGEGVKEILADAIRLPTSRVLAAAPPPGSG